jgi:DNA-binding transcriptional ArsR family regulator
VTPDVGVLDTRLAKALSHPLRQRLLMAYTNRVASPSEVAHELGESLGDVSYHTKRLLEHGCVELVRTVPGRGGVKHFYQAAVQYEVRDEEWNVLTPALRRRVAEPIVAQIVEDVAEAAASGALGGDDVHISRIRLELDDEARAELMEALRAVVEKAERLNRESQARRGEDGAGQPSALAILHLGRSS